MIACGQNISETTQMKSVENLIIIKQFKPNSIPLYYIYICADNYT